MPTFTLRNLRTLVCIGIVFAFAHHQSRGQAPAPTASFSTAMSFQQTFDGVEPISELTQDPSGNFYGTTYRGGQGDDGVVYKRTPSGTESILFDFSNDEKGGTHPQAGVFYSSSDNNLYGTTGTGGDLGGGTFFELTPAGVLTTLHSFDPSTEGSDPVGTLVQGADGNLYGVCASAGPANFGTAYKITKSGGFTLLHSFGGNVLVNNVNVPDGRNPIDSLCKGSDNNLYGVCEGGSGASQPGIVFSVTPTGSTYSILHTFNVQDGLAPSGALVEISAGTFLGVTLKGGTQNGGTIYVVSTSGLTKVYDFKVTSNDLFNPVGKLTKASDGLYYGNAANGGQFETGGGIFRTNALGETVVASFPPVGNKYADADSFAGLTLGADQLLYGVMETGGSTGQGLIFTVTTGGLVSGDHSFLQVGNSRPLAGLTSDAAGNLYGTTSLGGTSNAGTIFKISTTGTLNTLFNFDGLPDQSNAFAPGGVQPSSGSLVETSDGSLFGTTVEGGANGDGTVFKLDSAGNATTLHDFGDFNIVGVATDGVNPHAGLTASGGNFFGVTSAGGANNAGEFFEITPTGTFTSLQSLVTANGADPVASLTLGGDGNFYGTARFGGGSASAGALFSFTPAGTEKPLHSFSALTGVGVNNDGADPDASLVEGASRLFFGTAPLGGAHGTGNIFTITADGSTFTPLYSFSALTGFDNADGQAPGTLIKGSDGNFYGCTESGGANGNGTVFAVTSAGALTVLHTFSAADQGGLNADGAMPFGPLLETVPGVFHGTAELGGASGQGTVFTMVVSPVITSALSASATVAAPFSYTITGTNSPTRFAADGLPAGLTLNATTGVISGTPPAAGSFTFKIGAQNTGGFDNESFTLTVLPRQPTVTLTSPPTDLTVVTGASVALAAAVVDLDGVLSQVNFFLADANQGTVTAEPFELSITAPAPGSYGVVAVASDTLGRTAVSQMRTLTVVASGTPAPTVTLLSGNVDGLTLSGGSTVTLDYSVTADPNAPASQVNFFADGTMFASLDANGNPISGIGPGSVQLLRKDAAAGINDFWATFTVPGTTQFVNLIAVALDKLGRSQTSKPITLEALATTASATPAVSIGVTDESMVKLNQPIMAPVAATDPQAIAKVDFYVNGTLQQELTAAPFNFSFTPTSADIFVFTATSTDANGLSAVSAPIRVNAAPPPNISVMIKGNPDASESGAKAKFLISRDSFLNEDLTVTYKLKGTAKDGVDYAEISNSIVIPTGASSVKLKIKPIDNSIADGTRTVVLKLQPSAAGNYQINPGAKKATVSILDDD